MPAAYRILNRRIIGEPLDEVVGATVCDQLEIAADGRGHDFRFIQDARHRSNANRVRQAGVP